VELAFLWDLSYGALPFLPYFLEAPALYLGSVHIKA